MKKWIFYVFMTLPGFLLAQEELFKKEQFVQQEDTLHYRILYPEGFSEKKEYPVVLFLHGAGERGDDNESQLLHGESMFVENERKRKNPAIVIFPQCPEDDYWANVDREHHEEGTDFNFRNGGEPTTALTMVMGLMDELMEMPYIKKDKIYIGGLSMGAMGAFELLHRKPDTFAAAIAIAGGAHPKTAQAYAQNTELWIFHGAKDEVVSPEHSIIMAKAINEAGGKAHLTIYENATHNSWDFAFAEPHLLDWLFSRERK